MNSNSPKATCTGCAILALIAGVAMFFLTRNPFSGRDPRTEPAVHISDAKLAQAFMDNEVAAAATYNGKTAVVEGFIQKISKHGSDSTVTLGAHDVTLVECTFPSAHEADLTPLTTGQFVSIRGIVDGRRLSVELKECNLEKAGGVLDEAKPTN